MLSPTLAQLKEHLTVEVTWKSKGPWFKSGKHDFFYLFVFMKNKKNNLVLFKIPEIFESYIIFIFIFIFLFLFIFEIII